MNQFEVTMKTEENFVIKVAQLHDNHYNFRPRAIGGSFTFEMDVSNMDCGSVTGAYLVEYKLDGSCLNVAMGSDEDFACKRVNLI